jgi:hypothetical protein
MLATDTLITLTGGFVVRSSVAIWLIEAGFRLQFTVTDGELEVWPKSKITPADDAFIRAHRDELVAAVSYVDRMCEAPQ